MSDPPLLLAIVHYTACFVSIAFGSLLLFLLIVHTPSHLRVFAVLLRTLTLVELVTSIAGALAFPRLIPLGIDAAAIVINGPIKWITNDSTAKWIIYTIELHSTQQYNTFMSVAYCYRYYVLLRDPPSLLGIRLFTSTVYFISFALYVLFAFCQASPDKLMVYINRQVSKYNIDIRDTVGVVDLSHSLATPAIVWTVLSACILSVVNIFVGTAIYRYLKDNGAKFSNQSRAVHRQLFMALTLQALFGQLLLFSAGGYGLGQLDLIRSPTLEYGAHTMTEIAIASSPVISLNFIKPYRRALACLCRKAKVNAAVTTSISNRSM